MKTSDLVTVGGEVVSHATQLGASEVTARLSQSVVAEVGLRGGRVEKVQESRSLSLRVSLLVNDRYSTHATSDLRADALQRFLEEAIEATRALEPDRDRRLLAFEDMGSAEVAALDIVDDQVELDTPARRERCLVLERAVADAQGDTPVRSVGAGVWDVRASTAMVCSNGFHGRYSGTQHGLSLDLSLADADGRVPEAHASWSARHASDLPGASEAAAEAVSQGRLRLGSRPAKSGRYPMLVRAPRVGRLLSYFIASLNGQALHEGRSCFANQLGQTLSPGGFTLVDDPLVPRGLASRPYDSDGIAARALPIFEDGILRNFLIDVCYGRRLEMAPTTGGSSNLVIPPGARSVSGLLSELPQAMVVEGFLGGNANPATGNFSFGVSGTLYERGEPVQNFSEMNISGSLGELLERWVASASDVWTFGATRAGSQLFDAVQFSGS